jgi:hypothetical protein
MPASNGIGTARSVAKLYGCVATGGSEIGMTPGALDALITAGRSSRQGIARQGVARRHGVLVGLYEAVSEVRVRLVEKGFRNAWSRGVVRDG